jgi:hypothetical protein
MTPASFDPFSYLVFGIQNVGGNGFHVCTYAVAKNPAITFKISVSLLVVSLNPGVSMRATCLSSSVNLSAS